MTVDLRSNSRILLTNLLKSVDLGVSCVALRPGVCALALHNLQPGADTLRWRA